MKDRMKERIELLCARIAAAWQCLTAQKWCVTTLKGNEMRSEGTLMATEVASAVFVAAFYKHGARVLDVRVEMLRSLLADERVEMRVYKGEGHVEAMCSTWPKDEKEE